MWVTVGSDSTCPHLYTHYEVKTFNESTRGSKTSFVLYIKMENKYKSKKINGKKYDVHRIIWEKYHKIKLNPENVIHHIDGCKFNNSINNLMFFENKSEHTKWHHRHGDLHKFNGSNKRKLYNGKLICNKCNKLKDLTEFQKQKQKHLGVMGTCKKCRNLQVKKWRNASG